MTDDTIEVEVKVSFEKGDQIVAILREELPSHASAFTWTCDEVMHYEDGNPSRWVESLKVMLSSPTAVWLFERIGQVFGSAIKIEISPDKVSLMARSKEQVESITPRIIEMIEAQARARSPIANVLSNIGLKMNASGRSVFTCHTIERAALFEKWVQAKGLKCSTPKEADGGGMYSVEVSAAYIVVDPIYMQFNAEYPDEPASPPRISN